ncbi:unnamed protein product [Cyprideis torosa]|uniref:Polysaccharide biosynthesis domain-containing protein n=1 Tax=Cyprideis torosa TaxID=163714 RepID=A0A7R8WAT2_9CRUS|nr:unnamed protein product [Cyprideis torosa]CAG0886656.1 unnamed protein product [Cyprideis torosa]
MEDALRALGPGGSVTAVNALSRDAEEYVNNPDIERRWATVAFDYSQIHLNLLQSVDSKLLHLVPDEDKIYEAFRRTFPKLKVSKIKEDDLKSEHAKPIWRSWCEQWKGKVDDYNFATLLRLDSSGSYNEQNTCIVPRIQFYAIELARNREGSNDIVRGKAFTYHYDDDEENDSGNQSGNSRGRHSDDDDDDDSNGDENEQGCAYHGLENSTV